MTKTKTKAAANITAEQLGEIVVRIADAPHQPHRSLWRVQ